MAYPTPARWNPAAGPAFGAGRVEVWSRGQQIADVDCSDLLSATITDTYAIGVRRSLDMKVEPTAKWLRWARLPGLELRPYAGFRWGRAEFLCPMGRYPILPPRLSLPSQEISFGADDYWQWVVDYEFPVPKDAYPDFITTVIARLIVEAGAGSAPPQVLMSNQAYMPKIQWDRNAHEAIVQAAESIGAEVFMDRDGVPIIQPTGVVNGPPLSDGENGTITEITSISDWSDVKNSITITSSNDDVSFEPYVLTIHELSHPAAVGRIGHRPYGYESPVFTDHFQAMNAAWPLLAKKAMPAESWDVTALPDPSRDAGDIVQLTTSLGSYQTKISKVTHDLGGEPMKLTLGATLDPF